MEVNAMTSAAQDVLAERQRQIEQEGWTPEHDDRHSKSELSDAAACYAMFARSEDFPHKKPPLSWPWDAAWWKPTTPRCDLVKAAALILAEIERIDRSEQKGKA